MAVLNHHIVAATDKDATSLFFADVLGLEPPVRFGPFAVLKVSGETTLDFVDTDGDIAPLHYAFLVSEEEFDQVFARIGERGLTYWSDPHRQDPGHINHWDDGRGVYFPDPNGHMLEILTRPYGSGGTGATHPHPLVAAPVEATRDGRWSIGTACAEGEHLLPER
ncbi:MAG TPA: VOC family protein [Acidimicrobiales bacterium]|jgi:catechol 2,3-dioxygenase-like lactoylglutathione lyase family enzyme